MFKNKYVLGVLVAVGIFALSAGGGLLMMNRNAKGQEANLGGAAEAATTSQSNTNSNEPITISQDTMTGTQISQNSTGSTSASSEASKILDPTTFAQYDKYKDGQNVQFVDLQKGTGTTIAAGSQVAVLYRGWLTTGKVFDESKAGTDGKMEAFGFTEGQHQVIPGWEDGLIGAKDGGVRLLIIPPALGYGATGQGPIPGNSVLVFQVQIVQVK
jgi:FKBP-type peptidyl-prolyl cis-trans isomerase FkpA